MWRTLIAVLVAFIASVAAVAPTRPAAAGTCAENLLDSATDMSPESWNWDGPSEDDSNCDYAPAIRNKFDPNLLRLVVSPTDANPDSASPNLQPATGSGKERVRIQVLAKTEDMERAKALLLSLGGEISGTGTVAFVEGPPGSDVGIIQGWSPVRSLEELASSDAVSYVRIPLKALVFQEAIDESPAASFDLETWHKSGFRGGGVKVGVLDSGFAGILDREYQDLPLIETRSFADAEPDDPCGDRSQGTHSLRTIHEIAPEAELYAARIETLVDAQEAVSWLVNDVGVDIVRIPLVSFPVPDESLALPEKETENSIFAGNVFWATPEPATWKKPWSGPFQDRGDGFHLFAPNRNVEPAELPDDGEGNSGNAPATHVFLGWENPEGAKTDLDLHLLQWDGSGWNPVAESAKVQPGVLSRHPLEYLSTDSTGTERFYGYAVRGNTLAEGLSFEISTSEDNVFTDETSKPTSSMAAGMAALLASARPGLSAGEIQSLLAALCQDPNSLPEVLSGYEATIFRTKAGEAGCIEFLSIFNFTYCNGDPDFWVDHDEWGWAADRGLSAKRLEVECKVVNAGTNIRVLVNGSEVARWYAEVGEVHHVEDIDVEIAQEDTVVFGHGNAPDGCVDVDEDSPVRVVFWDTPIPTTGSLQVTIGPQGAIDAGAKWQVDGGEWQNSGDTVTELAEGNHTVSYSSVSGWSKPADASVSITVGETATASGTYTQQTGSLRVTISPQGAIDAGAKWRVDGGQWQNSGATVSGLTVGSHTVSYSSITGWNTPGNASVTVYYGQATNTSATYVQQTGALKVAIIPQEAIDAGAHWRVDGGTWRDSGATASGLITGSHTVSYKAIDGWDTPANNSVTVSYNQTTTASGTYVQQTGSLRVTISPQEAIDAGAQWRVDGGAWRNSGATVSGLSVGAHTVSYKAISGWDSPEDESVAISNGVTSTTTGTYVYVCSEREVLIALYNSTDGDNWTDNSGWKEPPLHTDAFAMPGTECGWNGITCDEEDKYVEKIDLHSNNLVGTIPAELGYLSNLSHLYLYSNQLSGSIPPELGNLGSLYSLYLYSNQLSGSIPPELGNLGSLNYLYLYSNQLSGSIPPELGNLGSLHDLSLYSNQLSGSIPPELGNLGSLYQLSLSSNQLSGPIPGELGSMSSLFTLRLFDNQLSGSIPPELGNLSSLSYLELSDNQLSGSIPPELGNLSSLSYLELSDNQLSGSIPLELGNLGNLNYLYLDSNQLWGCIPSSLGNCSSLEDLEIHNNQLSGQIPAELISLTNLIDWNSDLRNNHLYTANADLKNFLDQKQYGGDWESSQTFETDILRVEPSEQCGVYTPCFDSFQDAFDFSTSPSTIFVAEGEYGEKLVIENGDTLVLTWDKDFCCGSPSGPVILRVPVWQGKF